MKWAYGVTTVPARFDKLLPRTLHELALAGFGEPRLFVDGEKHPDVYEQRFNLEVTVRHPVIHVYGNWLLSMWELFIRDPDADRYAIFQDDLSICRNTRKYLDQLPYPEKGYCNLLTFMNNEALIKGKPHGWVPASQNGRGAVALVFSNEAVTTLLGCAYMAKRVHGTGRSKNNNLRRGWTHVDGGIVKSMNGAGWSEFVHNPSLVGHTGIQSQTGSGAMPMPKSFPGHKFDALEFLK